MNYTRQQIADVCRAYGPQLTDLPDGVDGAQLLWALAGNESSFGANCTPRYEPAYDAGGRYADAGLLAQFGRAAAMSYGPWQIMFVNCPRNYSPADMYDLDKASVATVLFLNRQLNRFRPVTLRYLGAIWNGGNPGAINIPAVAQYAERLAENYSVPMMELA